MRAGTVPVNADTDYLDFVRSEALSEDFYEVVSSFGGNPNELLELCGINPGSLYKPDSIIKFRAMINLFERAASDLQCPNFGLNMAKHCSEGISVLGPLNIAMRHASTLRDALDYCCKHIHVYSPSIHVGIEKNDYGQDYMLWDILLEGVPCGRQVAEHAVGLAFNGFRMLSNNEIKYSEVWFSHNQLAPKEAYRSFFGNIPVKFGMPFNALYFGKGTLEMPISNRNPQIYEMALSYIDLKFPSSTAPLVAQVRVLLGRLLIQNQFSQANIAELLGLHPRTLQRRLRSEGATFESIIDAVRREIALRNFVDGNVTLTEIADKLGYSETSVLTRSCWRWFNRSPRQIREEIRVNGVIS